MKSGWPLWAAKLPQRPVRAAARWAGILSLIGTYAWAAPVLPAAGAPSLIKLRSGEVIEGSVAKKVGENYIVLTRSGLRVVAALAVENIEELPPETPAPPPPPRASGDKGESSPPAAQGRASPSGSAQDPAGGPGAGEKAPVRSAVPRVVDPRLEAARSGGSLPVLEVGLRGTIAGKPLNPVDAFTLSRLTYFFSEVSRPRFEVLAPGETRTKAGARPGTPGGRPAEYRAEVVGLAEEKTIEFYNTPVLKTFKGQLSLRLVRLSDKKVVDGLDVVEDEGGDPSNAAELCRKAYNHAVESLLREIKNLPTFGGTATGSENGSS